MIQDGSFSSGLMCVHVLPIPRLKPFTSYQFRVKATNDIGDSEYSEESEAITTLQDGKSDIGGCKHLTSRFTESC